MQVTPTLERIAQAVIEGRLEHDLSQRRLAEFSGVSATSIRKLERGGPIDAALLIRLAATMVVLDAYRRQTPSLPLSLVEKWEAVS